jgi:hypothetical protein
MSEPSADPPSAIDHTVPIADTPADVPINPAQSIPADQQPQSSSPASPPPPQVKRPPSNRSADIERAVMLGEKRSTDERARREARMQKKEARIGISEAAVRAGAKEKEHAREERIAFRTETLKRRRELEADKRKKEEEEKKKQELERIRAAEQKKRDGYMADIRMTADAKIAIQHHADTLKAEYATDCQHVEFDHRTALEEAQRKHSQRCLDIGREEHERKNTLEGELKTKLYQLEGWHRMQAQALNTETAHELSSLRSMRDLNAAERKADDIKLNGYRKQRKLDSDWKDRRKAIEQENMLKQTGARNEAKEARSSADNELRAATHLADSTFNHRMEELSTTYKLQKRKLRVA